MFVYFLKMDSPEPVVKIGKTKEPQKRISSLKTANPFEMNLIALIKDGNEKEIHNQFNHFEV